VTIPIVTPVPPPTEQRDTSALGGAILGKDDFLLLLVTQLRNQDPMSPMDGMAFASQLAEFSSVEQLIGLGDKLDAMSELAIAGQALNETMLGASLVGKDALLEGSSVSVHDGVATQVVVDLPEGVEDATVVVYGRDGKPVLEQSFGALGAGRRTLTLDSAELAAGDYRYEVIAKDGEDQTLKVRTFTSARIDGMSILGGEVQLRVGGQLIPASAIIEIRAPAPAVPPTTTHAGETVP
jgi:flagellar basal-body rod modification protein FlgD